MTSSSFQPTGDVVEGVRCPVVIASVLLSGDHFVSMAFWISGRLTRPVQLRPGSHAPAGSSGTWVAPTGPAGIHAQRTSGSSARTSFALIYESLGAPSHRTGRSLGQCNDFETERATTSFATRSSGSRS